MADTATSPQYLANTNLAQILAVSAWESVKATYQAATQVVSGIVLESGKLGLEPVNSLNAGMQGLLGTVPELPTALNRMLQQRVGQGFSFAATSARNMVTGSVGAVTQYAVGRSAGSPILRPLAKAAAGIARLGSTAFNMSAMRAQYMAAGQTTR